MSETLLEKAKREIRFDRGGKPARGQEPWLRILGRCAESETGCWEYQGHRTTRGYGFARYEGLMRSTHRIVFMDLNGVQLAEDQFVCHRCDNPPCCNPAHLFLGDVLINNRDREAKGRSANNLIPGVGKAYWSSLTRCKRGHEFTGENVRVRTFADGRVHRRCRVCQALLDAARRGVAA